MRLSRANGGNLSARAYDNPVLSSSRNSKMEGTKIKDELVGEFSNQKEACREAQKLGASFTMLEKHKKHGTFRLEKV